MEEQSKDDKAGQEAPDDKTTHSDAPAEQPSEIEKLKEKCEEYLNGWKRAKADYINFKKESEKKQSEFVRFASLALILDLLPVLNNFKLAIKHIPEGKQKDKEIEGFILIKKQLEDLLKNAGVESIQTENRKFDPNFHEAVSHEKKDGVKEGAIIEEVAPGYKMHEQVIQVAKVKVAK